MKRLAIGLALMLMAGVSAPLRADEGKCSMCSGMMMDAGKKADHLAVMLDLNDKQKAEVQRLIEAKQAKLKPLMDQMKSTMKSAKDDFDAGINKVLNDKQKKKWEAMMDMREKAMDHK